MLKFSQFLNEYLTDEQRQRYENVEMKDKAREDTDHFFGAGNDLIREPIKGFEPDKSEVHRAIERHLGQTFSIDDYKNGMIRDQEGRKVTIPSLIKDKQLKHQFNQDNTRTNRGRGHTHYVTVVRGTEVAGQTNSAPDANHPKGYHWGNASCKNVDNGTNRHYLSKEIENGTVVVRVHDHDDKEIYRATLQPHHNKEGDTAYAVDSEYGLKHPLFTRHAHDVVARMSKDYKPGLFTKNAAVYNDNNFKHILHPLTTSEQLDQLVEDGNDKVRDAVAAHQNTSAKALHKILDADNEFLHMSVIDSPNIDADHLHKILTNADHFDQFTQVQALLHPKITGEHISTVLNKNTDPYVRQRALMHTRAHTGHIEQALKDPSSAVRAQAVAHPAVTKNQLQQVIANDSDPAVVNAAQKKLDKMS